MFKVWKIPLLFCYSRKDGSISVEISQAHDTLIEEHYTVSLMGPQMTGQMWVHYHVYDIQPLSIVLQLWKNIFTLTKPTHYIVQLPITASSNWPITIDERHSSSTANNTTERLNKQFQRTTSSTPEPFHNFHSSFRDVKLSWWRTTTIQNQSRCSIITWWVALGRGITTAPGALMSCRGATICRVSVVTSLFTLEE